MSCILESKLHSQLQRRLYYPENKFGTDLVSKKEVISKSSSKIVVTMCFQLLKQLLIKYGHLRSQVQLLLLLVIDLIDGKTTIIDHNSTNLCFHSQCLLTVYSNMCWYTITRARKYPITIFSRTRFRTVIIKVIFKVRLSFHKYICQNLNYQF